jgi:NAD+ diphosphatase
MFIAGYRIGTTPEPSDLVVAVSGSQILGGGPHRFAEVPALADPRIIGHLDGVPVWAGTVSAGPLVPWPTAAIAPLDGMIVRAVYDVRWRQTHRFCGECGGPLDDCPGFATRQCPRCTTLAYVPMELAPVVLVAIQRDRRLLMARHSYGPALGRWSMVGGFVEPGERLEEAAAREVREEVGLEIENIRYVTSRAYAVDNPGVLMTAFLADAVGATDAVVDGDELVSAAWFTPEEIETLPAAEIPPPPSLARTLIDTFLAAG